MTPGIGNARLRSLIEYFGSAKSVWQADNSDIVASKCLTQSDCECLFSREEKTGRCRRFSGKMEKQEIKLL